MNTPHVYALLLCAFVVPMSPACALLSKGQPGAPRFFSLDRAVERSDGLRTRVPETQGEPVELRLGRITGANHLEERLVFRDSAYEVRYYRELRWTEPPEVCLERLLARALFERRKLRHVVGGSGPTLDVHLTVFDEILVPQHVVRMQVVVRLHNRQLVLWEETLNFERPMIEEKGADPALAAVEALADAMAVAVDGIADRVVSELQ